ncbi:O-linked N-acetylglucosamine transferase, SPINDLY family protein, partial [Azospirillum sp. A39]
HPVGYFIEAVLAHHDPAAVEVFCYSTLDKSDDVTARLRAHAGHWRSLVGLSDDAAAALIRADAIDLLVDLSGHTAGNRLLVFARKPAPVQVSWLGYFGTTGLSAMDYVLADRHVAPEADDGAFTERVWRLPGSYLCFTPPDLDVAVTPRPPRPVTFGNFNNNPKTSPATIALWARVLARVPQSRLLLKTRALGDAAVRRHLTERFAAHGVAAPRLILEGGVPRAELLAAYNRVDVALDPTPYGGGTTTAEALWMGVPVVSLRGGTWVGRVSESILTTVGVGELVA